MMDNSMIVALKDIVVDFDGEPHFNGLYLDIHDKEFVTLAGPFGLRENDDAPRHRRVRGAEIGQMFFLTGRDITRLPPYKRQVNTVFQKYALFPHLNVFENVAFGLRLQESWTKERSDSPVHGDAGAGQPARASNGATRPRSPAGSSSGWPSRGRWSTIPRCCCWTSRWARWTSSCARICRIELKRIQQSTGDHLYLRHPRPGGSPVHVRHRGGHGRAGDIQQIGTPQDIYNEPQQRLCGGFYRREQHPGRRDACRTSAWRFAGQEVHLRGQGLWQPESRWMWWCGRRISRWWSPAFRASLTGVVENVIFKGVHYEMHVRHAQATSG